ncbi:alginate lyase family protein [Granulicella arctica]|uniref:alginate lyase family protein n=1 Tax=Granulicella arctica TaxID=940613 RepID=UPI0021DFFA3B|nr:alginate lyase family protein [Granulicella arctica]
MTMVFVCVAHAESVANPKASYIDVVQRHALLAHNSDPRIAKAIASLSFCTKLPVVPPPTGRMVIPPHYISGGHGPINPAEAEVTRTYSSFERRVTAGMNQWLVSSSRDEAQCAQQQIDAWAQAATLLDYDPRESSQAWFQVEWTLSSIAISESVLLNESSLDPTLVRRDIQWMDKVAHRTVDFDKAGTQTNNHHYWRALAAVSTGIISSDDSLFNWGIDVYKQAIGELDQRGAFPQEMARHERATHYQAFALQPLVPLAQFAERQHVPLYQYRSPTGRTIADAVDFFAAAIANPDIVKAYTPDPQLLNDGPDLFAFAEFYAHHVSPAQLSAPLLKGLEQPTVATRIGGSITVVDGYAPAQADQPSSQPRRTS